jgi:hypothetical protein
LQPTFLARPVCQLVKPRRQFQRTRIQAAGDQIEHFGESPPLQEGWVVGEGVIREVHQLLLLEAVDQNAKAVEHAESFGAYEGVQLALLCPCGDPIQQSGSDCWVVFAFKAVEVCLANALLCIERAVLQRGDPSHIAAIFDSDKKFSGRMCVERVLAGAEPAVHSLAQRRHPLWGACIESVGQLDKASALPT